MRDREISGKPRNLCCFECIFFGLFSRGSWTRPRLHNLLNGISYINKLERHMITSKITNGPEKQNEWKWFNYSHVLTVHPWWPRREMTEDGWRLGTRERGLRKWRRERSHKFLRLPGHSCKATATRMAVMYSPHSLRFEVTRLKNF